MTRDDPEKKVKEIASAIAHEIYGLQTSLALPRENEVGAAESVFSFGKLYKNNE